MVRCPYVCLSLSVSRPRCRRYRSIAARPAPQQHGAAARRAAANAGSAKFSAEHRLVLLAGSMSDCDVCAAL